MRETASFILTWFIRAVAAVVVLLLLLLVGLLVFPPLVTLGVPLAILGVPVSIHLALAARHQRGLRLVCYLEQATRLNLPLPAMLDAAAKGERPGVAQRLRELCDALTRGMNLAPALDLTTPEMPRRTVSLIGFGERIGRLPQMLARIIQQQNTDIEAKIRRNAGNYWMYGLVVALTLLATASAVMTFIIPKFEKIFADFDTDLPAVTKALISASLWLAGRQPGQIIPGMLYVLLAAALYVGLWLAFRFGGGGGVLGTVFWYLPIVRRVVRDRALATLCFSLSQATQIGLPLHLAVAECEQIALNSGLKARARQWRQGMLAGLSPAESGKKARLPSLLTGMLATTRTADDTGQVFEFLARYYGQRFDKTVTLLRAVVEPVMVLMMGLFVGFVVVGLFLPLVELIWRTVEVAGG